MTIHYIPDSIAQPFRVNSDLTYEVQTCSTYDNRVQCSWN